MTSKLKDDRGFTLIELLVVILLIGTIAAVALPNYVSKRDTAFDERARGNVRDAQTFLNACHGKTGDYSQCLTAKSLGKDFNLAFSAEAPTKDVLQITGTKTSYAIAARSETGSTFRAVQAAGAAAAERTCSVPENADRVTCPNSGIW